MFVIHPYARMQKFKQQLCDCLCCGCDEMPVILTKLRKRCVHIAQVIAG